MRSPKVEVQSQNNFIHSHLNKQYAFIGVNDLIVVDTADATLIARKGSTQMVKEVVESYKNFLAPAHQGTHL